MEKLLMLNKLISFKHTYLALGIFLLVFSFQLNASLNFTVNLNNIEDDQLFVTLKIDEINNDTLVLYFPKVVPGTYSVSDFGRFVNDIRAFNNDGDELKVKKRSVNEYLILESKELDYLTYSVDDTWDSKKRKDPIFGPNGTSFEKENVFILNNGGVFGCVKGYENDTIRIHLDYPEGLNVATTSQIADQNISYIDIEANGYFELIDAPIFIAPFDTAGIQMPGTNFNVCVYHSGNKKLASIIGKEIDSCLNAIEAFWGYLPIKDYTFNFYIEDRSNAYGQLIDNPRLIKFFKFFKGIEAGALEHKHSSFYVLLDFGDNVVSKFINDIDFRGFLREVVIHEYLHTITPIGLHSGQIGDINFSHPEMSRHLWLYEGVTDYFASLVMLQSGMVDLEKFFNDKMQQRVTIGKKYPYQKMSFTQMSQNVLKKKYNKQYQYVYTYGTILGLMLDLAIIKNSNGEQDLKSIVAALFEKYGYHRSFVDSSFIDEFLELAPEGCAQFFSDYIIGKKQVDFNRFLSTIGVNYIESDTVKVPDLLGYNNGILEYKVKRMQLLLNGDINVSFTTDSSLLKPMDKINYFDIEQKTMNGMEPLVAEGDTVYLNVIRNGDVLNIPFKVETAERKFSDFFVIEKDLTKEEEKYRQFWLGKP